MQHPHAKPPSGKPKSKRNRDGQPGHPRHERALNPVEQCDDVMVLKPTACRRCDKSFCGRGSHRADLEPLRYQVWEPPEIKPIVTEYQRHRLTCCSCGESTCGMTPWPKMWHNLRATRETELAESVPIHAVCQWIGHSEAVAKRHDLQVTDEHFAQAASLELTSQRGAKHEAKHEAVICGPNDQPSGNEKSRENDAATPCVTLCDEAVIGLMGAAGLEPATSTV